MVKRLIQAGEIKLPNMLVLGQSTIEELVDREAEKWLEQNLKRRQAGGNE